MVNVLISIGLLLAACFLNFAVALMVWAVNNQGKRIAWGLKMDREDIMNKFMFFSAMSFVFALICFIFLWRDGQLDWYWTSFIAGVFPSAECFIFMSFGILTPDFDEISSQH